jgi:hypothetical protein
LLLAVLLRSSAPPEDAPLKQDRLGVSDEDWYENEDEGEDEGEDEEHPNYIPPWFLEK